MSDASIGDVLWSPDAARVEGSAMTAFMKRFGASDPDDLWQRSVDDPAAFWNALWDFCG